MNEKKLYNVVSKKYFHKLDISFLDGHKFYDFDITKKNNIYKIYSQFAWFLNFTSMKYRYSIPKFTMNENLDALSDKRQKVCFYLDLDINKLENQSKTFINTFIKNVRLEIEKLFGNVETILYKNNKSDNVHFISRLLININMLRIY